MSTLGFPPRFMIPNHDKDIIGVASSALHLEHIQKLDLNYCSFIEACA